jgi:hypothetical protein
MLEEFLSENFGLSACFIFQFAGDMFSLVDTLYDVPGIVLIVASK